MRLAPHAGSSGAVTIEGALGAIQSFLLRVGFAHGSHTLALWVFFAGCGVAELCGSILLCTPIEHYWPLNKWPERNSITADVAYAFFVRIVLFPLVGYFEFSWLSGQLDSF